MKAVGVLPPVGSCIPNDSLEASAADDEPFCIADGRSWLGILRCSASSTFQSESQRPSTGPTSDSNAASKLAKLKVWSSLRSFRNAVRHFNS